MNMKNSVDWEPIKVHHIGQPHESKAIIVFKYGFSLLVYYASAHRWVLT
jgi:hypothetical protein